MTLLSEANLIVRISCENFGKENMIVCLKSYLCKKIQNQFTSIKKNSHYWAGPGLHQIATSPSIEELEHLKRHGPILGLCQAQRNIYADLQGVTLEITTMKFCRVLTTKAVWN